MNDSSSKPATAYFQADHPELQSVFVKIRQLAELNQLVLPLLEANLRPYCQVANITGKKLVLIAANGSIATQIRFQLPDLLRRFKPFPALAGIQEIQCKVYPLEKLPIAKQEKRKDSAMAPLSAETAAVVNEMAETMEDPRLKEIMKKIAGYRE